MLSRFAILAGVVGAAVLLGVSLVVGSLPDRSRDALESNAAFVTQSWPTDWSRATVPLEELILGVAATEPRDAIPPIDAPVYETVPEAATWLADREPGALVQADGEAYFFPLSIMNRHEIVNTEIAGVPLAVTYCPLCNTALAFDRTVDGAVLRFGVSGLLRKSDLVMWDDQTVSLWQQITGEAIVGDFAGTKLRPVSTSIVSFGDFAAGFPEGWSLSRNTGFDIAYGANPYEGYSARVAPLVPIGQSLDGRFPALERVVGVSAGGVDKAYPFSTLSEERVINDVVGGVPVVVWWGSPDTADALDRKLIVNSQAIGTALALNPVVDGETLTFSPDGAAFVDAETGSTWSILGEALGGPLEGARLKGVTHRNEFWFAWTAFFGEAEVYGAR